MPNPGNAPLFFGITVPTNYADVVGRRFSKVQRMTKKTWPHSIPAGLRRRIDSVLGQRSHGAAEIWGEIRDWLKRTVWRCRRGSRSSGRRKVGRSGISRSGLCIGASLATVVSSSESGKPRWRDA
jgi:hypothetical protein